MTHEQTLWQQGVQTSYISYLASADRISPKRNFKIDTNISRDNFTKELPIYHLNMIAFILIKS